METLFSLETDRAPFLNNNACTYFASVSMINILSGCIKPMCSTKRKRVSGNGNEDRHALWNQLKDKGVATYDKDSEMFLKLHKTIQNHHEFEAKVMKGLKAFNIRVDPKWKTYQCMIVHADNTQSSISIKNNNSYASKTDGSRRQQNFIKAIRTSVEPQIVSYLKNHHEPDISTCEICTCRLAWANAHVDHFNKHFSTIVNDYVSVNGLNVFSIEDRLDGSSTTGGVVFSKGDSDYEKQWQEYHRTHATLRLLCSKCNLIRGGQDTQIYFYHLYKRRVQLSLHKPIVYFSSPQPWKSSENC
jgi:hypothetical protein